MKFPIIWIPLNTVPNAMEDTRFYCSWYLVYLVVWCLLSVQLLNPVAPVNGVLLAPR